MAMAVLEDESSSVINQLIAMAGIDSAAFDMTGSWAEVASLHAAAAHAYLDGAVVYETASYASNENLKSAAQEADAAAGEVLAQAKIASRLRMELREAQRQVADASAKLLTQKRSSDIGLVQTLRMRNGRDYRSGRRDSVNFALACQRLRRTLLQLTDS